MTIEAKHTFLLVSAAAVVVGGLWLRGLATGRGAAADIIVAAPAPAADGPRLETSAVPGARTVVRPAVAPAAALRGEAAPAPTAAEATEALAESIRAGAPVSAPWTDDARRIITGWRATAGDKARGVTFGDLDCHQGGCVATATYADEVTFEVADESLTGSDAFLAFPGWRHRSFHRQPSGEVVATWLFMNPADAR